MKNEHLNNWIDCRSRSGIVLLMTLVILVMLSIVAYTLSNRIADRRHRSRYIVDYQAARYGCDSAVRYAFAKLQDINTPPVIARPNEPDFSDLFWRNEQEYEEYLANWKLEKEPDNNESFIGEVNDVNEINDVNRIDYIDTNSLNSLGVRGPYGPSWPFIIEPVEFEIGSATVRVEVEDENAKYPLAWALLEDEKVQREAQAGLATFCEWMDVNTVQIDSLKQQLKEIGEIKTFKLDFKPITEVKKTSVRSRDRRGRRGGVSRRRTTRKLVSPASVHISDFAKIFHSSLINTEALARPTIVSESRKESALKYIGLWASKKVNINTAPRQVLEAAFTFGGDADKIAEEIIQRRRIEPFKNIEDLRKSLFRYSDSIEKCKEYITTASSFFTIRITAVSGTAKASTIIAITKDGKKMEKIAVTSG